MRASLGRFLDRQTGFLPCFEATGQIAYAREAMLLQQAGDNLRAQSAATLDGDSLVTGDFVEPLRDLTKRYMMRARNVTVAPFTVGTHVQHEQVVELLGGLTWGEGFQRVKRLAHFARREEAGQVVDADGAQ